MKTRVAIIGSGDMAVHIAHFLKLDSEYEFIGFFDDFCDSDKTIDNKPLLGRIESVEEQYAKRVFDKLIIAVGYSRMEYRKQIYNRTKGTIALATFIHKSCVVDPLARIEEGCVLFPGCIIDRNVCLKGNVFLHNAVVISHDTTVKENCYISPAVSLAGFVEVGESCVLGIGTVIIDNISIVDSVITGAGSVIVESIQEEGVYVGVPVRKLINDR
ncbi:MAG: hypothetical protein C0592_05195 [Marinilabiliales bacterium]|nr:MAG: hypothetical protein C0592_05195 [Marinilabiliales bacterium]